MLISKGMHMTKKIFGTLFIIYISHLCAQAPDTLWTKRYSITPYFEDGELRCVKVLSNEQYYIVGNCEVNNQQDIAMMIVDTLGKVKNCSFIDFGSDEYIGAITLAPDSTAVLVGQKRNAGNGDFDILIMKTDLRGDTLWTRHYGDNYDQAALSVVATNDSCFAIAGYTTIDDTTAMLIMKINTDGDTMWTKIYGGSPGDTAMAIVNTQDDGYVITGQREIALNDYDLCILKIDANGDSIWAKNYGTSQRDIGNAIAQTTDGGFLITGIRENNYTFIVRTDSVGDTLWTTGYDYLDHVPLSLIVISDTEFVIGGYNDHIYGDTIGFMIKFNDFGNEKWYDTIPSRYNSVCWSVTDDNSGNIIGIGKCDQDVQGFIVHVEAITGDVISLNLIYGTERENAHSLILCSDNGYVFTGWKRGLRTRTDFDILLMKTDPNGDSLWAKTYGGRRGDIGYDVIQTYDNGYAIIGATISSGAGRFDVCLLKTDANGNLQWIKTYGGNNWDFGHAGLQTDDNGYIILCEHYDNGNSKSDIYVIKTDANGDTSWTKIYDNADHEIGYDICEGTNGGFLIVGHRLTYPNMFGGGLFVRINDNGDTLWTTTLPGAVFNSVIQASDNGYIAVGTKERGGMNQFVDLCFVKISDNGVIEWIKNYNIDNSPDEAHNEGYSVTSAPDGGYVGVGYSMPTSGYFGRKIFLVRTDAHGDSLWTKVVDSIGVGSFVDNFTICRTQDDGYIIGGGNDWAESHAPWHGDHHIVLVRLGPETGIQETTHQLYTKPLLFVRPTIFNRQVIIDYQVSYSEQSELDVYDATGRLVKTLKINKDARPSSVVWHGFNDNGLPVPSGTYYIVLRSGVFESKQKIVFIQ